MMAKLRAEVEEALRGVRAKYGPGLKPTRMQLLALVELGVRLGLEAAQLSILDESTSLGKRIVEAIRVNIGAAIPADILYDQPEEETR